jgi:hypothetical protein
LAREESGREENRRETSAERGNIQESSIWVGVMDVHSLRRGTVREVILYN